MVGVASIGSSDIMLPAETLAAIFPFHLAFDAAGVLLQVGVGLQRVCPDIVAGARISGVVELLSPLKSFSVDELAQHQDEAYSAQVLGHELRLRGQMLVVPQGIIYLAHPVVTGVDDVPRLNLTFVDFPPHTGVVDFLVLLQQKALVLREIEHAKDRLRRANAAQQALLEVMPGVMLQFGSDGKLTGSYHAPFTSMPLRFEQGRGKGLSELFDPDSSEALADAARRAKEHRRPLELELSLAIDGATRDFEARVVTSDAGGTVVLLRDISARARMVRNFESLPAAESVCWQAGLIAEITAGDETLERGLVANLIRELPALSQRLSCCAAEGSYEGVLFAAHSLKGVVRMFTNGPLFTALNDLEGHARRAELGEEAQSKVHEILLLVPVALRCARQRLAVLEQQRPA